MVLGLSHEKLARGYRRSTEQFVSMKPVSLKMGPTHFIIPFGFTKEHQILV